jgi:ATP phosphoribosyltransferase regulatory subunit
MMIAASMPDADTQAERLLAAYGRAGYKRVSPAILQPAEPFLDMSGEDMRRHMYLVTDASGRELCLRPDLTIPVARHYLATGVDRGTGAAVQPAGFCYLGLVFRDRGEGTGEFLQAGIESFGRTDTADADAEALARALEATAHYGLPEPDIAIGDVALFAALIAALDLAPAWQRRLLKDFRKAAVAQDLQRLTVAPRNGSGEYQGVLTALAHANPKAAHAMVTDLLSIAGIGVVGGRSVGEIADRFVEQAELGAADGLPSATRTLIERFLGVAGAPHEAAAALRALVREAKISLGPALELFEHRTRCFAARGIDIRRIRFATAFGRGVDYYTGFVFEVFDPARRLSGQLAAGGRYDSLLTRLGSAAAIPAVGFAVWIERLAALGAAGGEKA